MDIPNTYRPFLQQRPLARYLTVERLLVDLYDRQKHRDEIKREESYEYIARKVANHFDLLDDLTNKKEKGYIPEQIQEVVVLLIMCLKENSDLAVLSISNFETHAAFTTLLRHTTEPKAIKAIVGYANIVYINDNPTDQFKKGLELYSQKQCAQL